MGGRGQDARYMRRVLCDPRLDGLYISEIYSHLIDKTGSIGESTLVVSEMNSPGRRILVP